MTLVEVLRDGALRRKVVAEGAALVEREVAARSGLSGVAIKAGFSALKRVKPGIVPAALDALLPEFAPAIDPLHAKALAEADPKAWYVTHAGDVADALLAVTDRRAARAQNQGLKKVYSSLRGTARAQVVQSVPGLAELILQNVPR